MSMVIAGGERADVIRHNRVRTRAMVLGVALSSSKRAEEIVRKRIQQRYRLFLLQRVLAAVLVPICLYLWWPFFFHLLDGSGL